MRYGMLVLETTSFHCRGRGATIRLEEGRKCQRAQLFFVGRYSSILFFVHNIVQVRFSVYFNLLYTHKDTPVIQMVNPNFHQTNKKILASGNAQIKRRVNLWTYCADESCPRKFYNTLLLTVLFVPQSQSALNVLEDLGPL